MTAIRLDTLAADIAEGRRVEHTRHPDDLPPAAHYTQLYRIALWRAWLFDLSHREN